jgi:hypothetical protein
MGGRITLINEFRDFRQFLATVKTLNPAINVKGL